MLEVMVGSIFFLANALKPVLKKFGETNTDRIALTAMLTKSVWLYIGLLLVMLWSNGGQADAVVTNKNRKLSL